MCACHKLNIMFLTQSFNFSEHCAFYCSQIADMLECVYVFVFVCIHYAHESRTREMKKETREGTVFTSDSCLQYIQSKCWECETLCIYVCVSVLKHKLGFKCGLKAILGVYDFIMAACSQPIIFSLCHCHFSVSQALCWDVTCVIFKYFQIWFIWRVLHRNLRICSST